MAEKENRIIIRLEAEESGLTVHSSGSGMETRTLLLAAVCRMYGIPENHVSDAAAFLAILGEEYRKEEKEEYH